MFIYEKRFEYPLKEDTTKPALSAMIVEKFGGIDGELSSSIRYLTKKCCSSKKQGESVINNRKEKELPQWEIVATKVWKLSKESKPMVKPIQNLHYNFPVKEDNMEASVGLINVGNKRIVDIFLRKSGIIHCQRYGTLLRQINY